MLALKVKVITPERQDPGQPVAMTGHGHGHHVHASQT